MHVKKTESNNILNVSKLVKTKIVCTLGPVSSNAEMLEKMIIAGMDIVRLNFSHGDHEDFRKLFNTVQFDCTRFDLTRSFRRFVRSQRSTATRSASSATSRDLRSELYGYENCACLTARV